MSRPAMMESLDKLESDAVRLIESLGLPLRRRLPQAGLFVDLMVYGEAPEGLPKSLALQIRPWPESTWRKVASYADHETGHLKSIEVASQANILVPGNGPSPDSLITLDGLKDILVNWRPPTIITKQMRSASNPATSSREVAFCAMPFHEDFLDVYLLGILPATNQIGFDVNRLDQTHSFEGITKRIWDGISNAAIVIADISGHNPNVMYEIGLAHAFGCHTFVVRDSTTDIPFDIKDSMALTYDRKKLHRFQQDLAERLRQALNNL